MVVCSADGDSGASDVKVELHQRSKYLSVCDHKETEVITKEQ